MHVCEDLKHLRHKSTYFSLRERSLFPFLRYLVQIVVHALKDGKVDFGIRHELMLHFRKILLDKEMQKRAISSGAQ